MDEVPADRCGAEWDPPWLDILRDDEDDEADEEAGGPDDDATSTDGDAANTDEDADGDSDDDSKSTHEHCCFRETWDDREGADARCWWHMDDEKSVDDLRERAAELDCGLDQVPGARLETEANRALNSRLHGGEGGDTLDGEPHPMPTTLLCDAVLPGVELRDNFALAGAWLNGADLSAANLKDASLAAADVEAVDLRGATLRDADLTDADLRVNAVGADFREATLDGADACVAGLGYASLPRPDFSNAHFHEASLVGADLSGADVSDARFERARLCGANLENAALERANFFDADLTNALLYGAVLGEAQINRGTTFFPDGEERCAYHPDDPTLRDRVRSALPWTDTELPSSGAAEQGDAGGDDESQFEKAAWTYRTIERLARQNSFPSRQRRMYLKRQHMETRMHARDDGVFGRDHVFARVSQVFINHGEGPLRVLAWGAVVILSFALLYPFGGWIRPISPDGTPQPPVTWDAIAADPVLLWESVYYSTLTFTNLGFGDFRPEGTVGQALTVAETGSGAVLLALLVFVLGRRAAR